MLKRPIDYSTSTSETSQNVYIFVFISSVFEVSIFERCFFDAVRNQTSSIRYLCRINQRRSKDHQKNMSSERDLSFDL